MTADTHARIILDAMAASAEGARANASRDLLEGLVETYRLRADDLRAAIDFGIHKGWFIRSRTGTLSLSKTGLRAAKGDESSGPTRLLSAPRRD